MVGREAVIVAGIGCRRDCPGEEIADLVRRALADAGLDLRTLDALAAPVFKRDETGLLQAAEMLRRPLTWLDQPALKATESLCPTRSPAALAATGIASVAESAALAAAGPGARLILPRIAGARATCALAEGTAP